MWRYSFLWFGVWKHRTENLFFGWKIIDVETWVVHFKVEDLSMEVRLWKADSWFWTFGVMIFSISLFSFTLLCFWGRTFGTWMGSVCTQPGGSCLIVRWVLGLLSYCTRFDPSRQLMSVWLLRSNASSYGSWVLMTGWCWRFVFMELSC